VTSIEAAGTVLIPPGSHGAGTLLVAGHAGSSGHEGDLTLRLDTVTTPDGDTLEFHDQRIRLNGRNRRVTTSVLGFVPYAGIGARFIRGQESVVQPSTEIRTVLTADATMPSHDNAVEGAKP